MDPFLGPGGAEAEMKRAHQTTRLGAMLEVERRTMKGAVTAAGTAGANDVVIAQPGSDLWINSTVDYTLPTNVDALFLYGGPDAHRQQRERRTFVVYNSSDVMVPKVRCSHDIVYAAVNYIAADRD